ncbi:MAG TPA: SMI1/KNR4 family protein [Gemmataceae bacterium]|jgi:hypothetical protein
MAQIAHPLPAGPTTDAQIAAFETYIGHKLPTDYRQFLLQHNGGHPEPDAFLLRANEIPRNWVPEQVVTREILF